MIVQLNSQSIHECDPSRLGDIDVRPHYVSYVTLPEILIFQRPSGRLPLIIVFIFLVDNASICRVLRSSCKFESGSPVAAGGTDAGCPAERGGELHPPTGSRVPSEEGAVGVPHQQL